MEREEEREIEREREGERKREREREGPCILPPIMFVRRPGSRSDHNDRL